MQNDPFKLENDAEQRVPVIARRMALARMLLRERYLTRETLMVRIETALGFPVFGRKSWRNNFFRDMQVVKAVLGKAGYEVKYSRKKGRQGYYFAGEPALHPDVQKEIAGALQELDDKQIEIYRQLSPAQKFHQGCSITNFAQQVARQRRSL